MSWVLELIILITSLLYQADDTGSSRQYVHLALSSRRGSIKHTHTHTHCRVQPAQLCDLWPVSSPVATRKSPVRRLCNRSSASQRHGGVVVRPSASMTSDVCPSRQAALRCDTVCGLWWSATSAKVANLRASHCVTSIPIRSVVRGLSDAFTASTPSQERSSCLPESYNQISTVYSISRISALLCSVETWTLCTVPMINTIWGPPFQHCVHPFKFVDLVIFDHLTSNHNIWSSWSLWIYMYDMLTSWPLQMTF